MLDGLLGFCEVVPAGVVDDASKTLTKVSGCPKIVEVKVEVYLVVVVVVVRRLMLVTVET